MDEYQELALAIYTVYPKWDETKAPWIPFFAKYAKWVVLGMRKRETIAIRLLKIENPQWVPSTTVRIMANSSECNTTGCAKEVFSKGKCQTCYRRTRRKEGRDKRKTGTIE